MSDQKAPLAYKGSIVQPFPVTVYYLRDERSWLENFNHYHERLFELARISDLYSKQKKLKRKLAQERDSMPKDRVPF